MLTLALQCPLVVDTFEYLQSLSGTKTKQCKIDRRYKKNQSHKNTTSTSIISQKVYKFGEKYIISLSNEQLPSEIQAHLICSQIFLDAALSLKSWR